MPRATRPNRRTPNTLGTVEKLPSGRYRAFYRTDGEKFSAPTTFATKDEATAWLAGERADRARGVWADPRARTLTLGEYADAYLTSRADLAPRTQHGYRRLIERYIDTPLQPRRGRPLTLGAIASSARPTSPRTSTSTRARGTLMGAPVIASVPVTEALVQMALAAPHAERIERLTSVLGQRPPITAQLLALTLDELPRPLLATPGSELFRTAANRGLATLGYAVQLTRRDTLRAAEFISRLPGVLA